MQKAYIENNVAITIARVDPFSIFIPEYAALFVEVPEEVEAGWIVDDEGKWSAPPVVVIVPQEITPLQGLLALDKFGFSAAFEAWESDPARTFSERAFINRAQTWRRNDPVLSGSAGALGLTEAQLDELFIEAALL